jgi:cyanophycinase
MLQRFALTLCLGLSLTAAPPRGTLVIVGGGGTAPDIEQAFLQACGGKGARIGIIPTASSEPDAALAGWKKDLDAVGATMVSLDVRAREDSSRPELLEAARTCTGFWFSGGDQSRIGDKIVGTPLHQLLLARYQEGAGVGGTSAGAAIMSRAMLTGEDLNGKEQLVEMGPGAYKTREGMGFLPEHVLIDQHFLRRSRENRMLSLIMGAPGALGFGIDEATALVVKDGVATVAGRRGVLVFDSKGMALQGESFRDLRIHFLRRGQAIDLGTRKLR